MYFESKLPLSSGKLICLENLGKFENALQGYGKFTKMFCKDMENFRKCFARIGKIFENVLQRYGKFSKNFSKVQEVFRNLRKLFRNLWKNILKRKICIIYHIFSETVWKSWGWGLGILKMLASLIVVVVLTGKNLGNIE